MEPAKGTKGYSIDTPSQGAWEMISVREVEDREHKAFPKPKALVYVLEISTPETSGPGRTGARGASPRPRRKGGTIKFEIPE